MRIGRAGGARGVGVNRQRGRARVDAGMAGVVGREASSAQKVSVVYTPGSRAQPTA